MKRCNDIHPESKLVCARDAGHGGDHRCNRLAWAATPVNDPIHHPKHYTNHKSGIECIQIVEHMGFCRGNAIKYIWRAGEKGPPIDDLKKAIWYLEREIKRLENA